LQQRGDVTLASVTRYSVTEVAKHNTLNDAWLIINGYVYDVTQFARNHPGGVGLVEEVRKSYWGSRGEE